MKKTGIIWKGSMITALLALNAWFAPTASAADLIAASIANQINQAWINMGNGIKSECKKLGYDLLMIDAQDNTAKQISDTEDALTKGPKFLLLTGVDKGTAQLIDMAKKKGIPTITLMRDYGGDVVSFVGVDNVKVGEGIIDWYGKFIKGKQSKVIIITGTPGAASSTDRETGVNKTLPKYTNIKELSRQSGYYRREKTLPVVEDLLQRHSDVDAVLGFNDEIAMGALAAAKAQKRNLVITGTDGNADALKAIQGGDITMSLVFDMVDMGRKGVQFADMALKGKPVPKQHNMEMIFVTRDNVAKYIDINK
jgi:ribose transport system substrate-binding protein